MFTLQNMHFIHNALKSLILLFLLSVAKSVQFCNRLNQTLQMVHVSLTLSSSSLSAAAAKKRSYLSVWKRGNTDSFAVSQDLNTRCTSLLFHSSTVLCLQYFMHHQISCPKKREGGKRTSSFSEVHCLSLN